MVVYIGQYNRCNESTIITDLSSQLIITQIHDKCMRRPNGRQQINATTRFMSTTKGLFSLILIRVSSFVHKMWSATFQELCARATHMNIFRWWNRNLHLHRTLIPQSGSSIWLVLDGINHKFWKSGEKCSPKWMNIFVYYKFVYENFICVTKWKRKITHFMS
jgi:hypothetical protein